MTQNEIDDIWLQVERMTTGHYGARLPEVAAVITKLVAEIERLREENADWQQAADVEARERKRAHAKLREAVEVMWTLYHAACGPTGFAAAVRATSGVPYPWPALDEADDLARAFLASMEKLNER